MTSNIEPTTQYEEGTQFDIRWEISADAESPLEAARYVWRQIFGRGEPGPDDACVFTVSGPDGEVLVDLSEHTADETDSDHG